MITILILILVSIGLTAILFVLGLVEAFLDDLLDERKD